MKAKEKEEKQKIRLRFAVGLSNALKDSKYKSYRDLALNTGFEPAHIQRIATGKVDVVLTTAIALAEGLGIKYSELAQYYETVTEKQINNFIEELQQRKRKTVSKKGDVKLIKNRKK